VVIYPDQIIVLNSLNPNLYKQRYSTTLVLIMAITSARQNQHATLTINGLQLFVFLGVYPEEKVKPQCVSLDIKVEFIEPPKACSTDQLADTYCYHQLIDFIKEMVAKRKFQLIEYLTAELHSLLKSYFPASSKILLKLTKKPPVSDLMGGVTFELKD
jgi:7,8-dihydroneopterin aldolase/epimerase/oxygenase